MSSSKQIGRPKLSEQKKDAMRKRLLACAKDAFIAEGYQSVSIRKIAKAASCNPMSFYQYFDNKHALLRSLWADYFVELFEQCHAAANQHTSPLKAVRAFIRAYAKYWFEHKQRYRLVFLIEDRLIDNNDRFYVDSAMIGDQFDILTELLTESVNRNETDLSDPIMSAQLLIASISGLLHTHITISEYAWLPFEVMLEQLMSALLPEVSKTQ